MQILYVLQVFPKVTETFILNQMVRMVKRGHNVRILSYLAPGELNPPESFLPPEAVESGLLENTLYARREIGDFANLYGNQFSSKLRETLGRSDVLLAHFCRTPLQMAERLASFARRPHAFFAHAYDLYVQPDADALRFHAGRAERIFLTSQYNIRSVSSQVEASDIAKIRLIRSGVDHAYFRLSETERAGREESRQKPIILSVGRFVEKKGFADGLEAFARVCDLFPAARFRIIGEGPLEGYLKSLAEKLGIAGQVDWLGLQPHSRVREEYARSHVFLAPSCIAGNGDREGLPNTIVEAAAMELPVVSTLHTGIPEAVLDGESGCLVAEHDIDGLAEGLIKFLSAPELSRKSGLRGRKWICEKFDPDDEIECLVTSLEEII